MTGLWLASINGVATAVLDISQTGMALQIQGEPPYSDLTGTGTIDPMTGAFSIQFAVSNPPAVCGALFDGQLTANGNGFIAPGSIITTAPECHSIFCACQLSAPAELRGSRAPCGNQTVESGEDCDDGQLGLNGSCCAVDCTARPVGEACTSDQNFCTNDVCAALGVCTHPAVPDGTSCNDGQFCNGEETDCQAGACNTGTNPCALGCDESTDQCVTSCPLSPQSCRAAEKSLLSLKRRSDPTKNTLLWKWLKGAATSQTEFGDPTDSADYALCMYAFSNSSLVWATAIPAGTAAWTALGSAGFKYDDPSGAAFGIDRVLLHGSTQNKSKIVVKGRGSDLPPFQLQLTDPLTVQLYNGDNALCWGATYSVAQMLKNDGERLKAKAP